MNEYDAMLDRFVADSQGMDTELLQLALHYRSEADKLRKDIIEIYANILYKDSYEHEHHSGWWHHTSLSDQVYALAYLVEMGEFRIHPEHKHLYQPVDPNHKFYAYARAIRKLQKPPPPPPPSPPPSISKFFATNRDPNE